VEARRLIIAAKGAWIALDNLLDAAESLIISVDIPDAGPAMDRERERVDADAGDEMNRSRPIRRYGR